MFPHPKLTRVDRVREAKGTCKGVKFLSANNRNWKRSCDKPLYSEREAESGLCHYCYRKEFHRKYLDKALAEDRRAAAEARSLYDRALSVNSKRDRQRRKNAHSLKEKRALYELAERQTREEREKDKQEVDAEIKEATKKTEMTLAEWKAAIDGDENDDEADPIEPVE